MKFRHIFSLALGVLIVPLSAREAMDRPNVVLIYLDDSGYGDYAHHGNPVIETPTITKMAMGGAEFTQFYVASPACSASRYSLLTGRYPGRSKLGGWVVGPDSKNYLRPSETTIAEALKKRGYATGIFGKWHLGSPNAQNNMSADTLPLAHGFDQWIGTNVSHDYDNSQLLQSDPQGDAPIKGYKRLAMNLPSNRDASTSLTARYTQEATKFIEANKEQPFFAYLAYNQPHLGLYASEKFTGTSRRGLLGDVMAEIDDAIAQVLQSIEKSGITRNTLVIFSSDNGPWILYQNVAKNPKYGEARLHVGYAQPFRDGKGSNWEGGHRVPGIFYWPGVIEPRHQLEPASTLDVLPTVLRLCGADVPNNIDGRDIRPLLSPTRFTQDVAPFSFAYSGDNNLPNAYREGPWKLHVKLISQTGDLGGFSASLEKPLLFQVEQDLGERIDRAAEHPEIVERLRKKLKNLTESLQTTH